MEKQQQWILVSAPNKAGEAFIRQLIGRQLPFAVIVNNKAEQERLTHMGVKKVHVIDTASEATWMMPKNPIGKIFLFESSLNLTCRYLQICRKWTSEPIYVITHSSNPKLIYKALGANYVIHTTSHEISFLVSSIDG